MEINSKQNSRNKKKPQTFIKEKMPRKAVRQDLLTKLY